MTSPLNRLERGSKAIDRLADAIGGLLVDGFHYLALFAIGGAIVWSAAFAFADMVATTNHDAAELAFFARPADLPPNPAQQREGGGQSARPAPVHTDAKAVVGLFPEPAP